MTTVNADVAASIVAELSGSSDVQVDMMIGIGLVKDSDAVYFQYLGEEKQPAALTLPSGKPCTRMANVRVTGITIVEGVGSFKATKINLFLETTAGRTIMLTSGIQSWWTQCVIQGLMGMFNAYALDTPFTLDSYRGKAGLKPVFATIRQGGKAVSDQHMYQQMGDLRRDKASDKIEACVRDAVAILGAALTGNTVDENIMAAPSVGEVVEF